MRTAEIILSFIACAIVANALGVHFANTRNYLPSDLYSPLTVLSIAWLLALVYSSKSVARLK
jgi:hypothetical protein